MKNDNYKKNSGRLIFREVQNKEELLEHFKLRYKVYSSSRLKSAFRENDYNIDIDWFDIRARHFVLTYEDGYNSRIIGCQRGVYPPGQYINENVKEIFDDLKKSLQIEYVSESYPCLSYLPASEQVAVRSFCDNKLSMGKSIGESSRFSVDPEFSSIRLAVWFARAVVAVWIYAFDTDFGLNLTYKSQKRFYLKHGFRQLYGTSDILCPKLGSVETMLVIHKNFVSPDMYTVYAQMAEQFAGSGQICYDIPNPLTSSEKKAILNSEPYRARAVA
jgi:hypothetical protein